MIVDAMVGVVFAPVCANAVAGVAHARAITTRYQRQEHRRVMSVAPVRGHIIAAGYLSVCVGKLLTEGDS